VIVPTYNRPDFLGDSLASVCRQTRKPDEIIVVDDGSDPPVEDTVRRLCYPFGVTPKVIRLSENRGKSVAVNYGLLESTGDLIWIFDDDDLALPDRLETLLPLFENDPTLDLVHTDAEWFDPVTGEVVEWRAENCPQDQILRRKMRGNFWFTISVMFRRKMLDRLKEIEDIVPRSWNPETWPLDPRLERAQDYDFWIRLAWAGARVCAVNHKTVRARRHKGKRGRGHRLSVDQIFDRTIGCEKVIFHKVYGRIPLSHIFSDYNTEAGRQNAHFERAFALCKRGLLDYAAWDLRQIREPRLLGDEQRLAMIVLFRWAATKGWNEGLKELSRISGSRAISETRERSAMLFA
jgi:glycosyltransferase involved in cell wall biosynthesis